MAADTKTSDQTNKILVEKNANKSLEWPKESDMKIL
jgi:hypothetical protein